MVGVARNSEGGLEQDVIVKRGQKISIDQSQAWKWTSCSSRILGSDNSWQRAKTDVE